VSLIDELARTLRREAAGGRVVNAPFLEPEAADALLKAVPTAGVEAEAWGGFAGARRRVVTARPDHVPGAQPALCAWYAAGVVDPDALRAAVHAHGVAPESLGDAVRHADGCSIVALASTPCPAQVRLEGAHVALESVPVERVAGGSRKRVTAVVPSLRVDVLGARAFGVSRSWFAKGVAAGHVAINGRRADKRSEASAGDEVYAEQLGRFRVVTLLGATRKGNARVELDVERS